GEDGARGDTDRGFGGDVERPDRTVGGDALDAARLPGRLRRCVSAGAGGGWGIGARAGGPGLRGSVGGGEGSGREYLVRVYPRRGRLAGAARRANAGDGLRTFGCRAVRVK